jgi:hypothetical protein
MIASYAMNRACLWVGRTNAPLPAGSSLPLKQICMVVNTARPGVMLRIVRVHLPTRLRSGSASPNATG